MAYAGEDLFAEHVKALEKSAEENGETVSKVKRGWFKKLARVAAYGAGAGAFVVAMTHG